MIKKNECKMVPVPKGKRLQLKKKKDVTIQPCLKMCKDAI